MVRMVVDNKEIETEEGATVLQACLENGIYIPNLCYLKEMDKPPDSCRLCFVEIDGYSQPITSCTVKVKKGIAVKTSCLSIMWIAAIVLPIEDVNCRGLPGFYTTV